MARAAGGDPLKPSWPLLAVVVLVAVAPAALARPVYTSEGKAVRGAEVDDAIVFRHPDKLRGVTTFRVLLFDATHDLLGTPPLVDVRFDGSDNYVDVDEAPGPLVANTAYHAESTTPGVHFRLDGFQAFSTVTAHGEFQDYVLAVSPNLLGV